MLLDPARDWALARRSQEVLESLPAPLSDHASDETQDAVLELTTDPCDSPARAAAAVQGLRRQLAGRLERMGLVAASAGTHPSTSWTETEIAEGERHQEVYDTMRELARREPTFGMHVHIGVADPEAAIRLFNGLRPQLPLLLALSANSPYWQGRDTGLASVRTPIFQAFPRVGIPRAFDGYEDWEEAVDRLLRCGAFADATFLWWDVRPQPKFGTVEVRIMDAQSDVEATAALTALVQAMAHRILEAPREDDPVRDEIELIAENRFLASRDGMDASLIDPERERCVPARDLLGRTLDELVEHAQALGSEAELAGVRDLARATGADRQRRARGESTSLSAVLADLVARF